MYACIFVPNYCLELPLLHWMEEWWKMGMSCFWAYRKSFQFVTIECDVKAVDFSWMSYIKLRKLLSDPSLLIGFSHESVLDFVKCFLSTSWDDRMASFFIPLMWCITYIDLFLNGEPSLHSGNKFHLDMVYNSFQYAAKFSFLGIFASIFIRDIGPYFLFCFYMVYV